MASLERTAIGDFTIETAIDLNDLSADSLVKYLLPAEAAVRQLDTVELTKVEIHKIRNGLSIERKCHGFSGHVAAFDATGHLVAIVAPRSPDQLRPISNLAVASENVASTAR
jgi:tRNA U55 pseudouridine synthase TruB